MAIYHLNAQVISRAKGRSATAAAAYRAAELIADNRTGISFNYTRKQGVTFKAIYAPHDAPEWCHRRHDLWNEVEQAEVRRDAQVAREVNVALPRELSAIQHVTLLERFVTSQFVKSGMVADIAIHSIANSANPHAHILLTLRTVTSSGFGKKCRSWNDRDVLETWREEWALHCNRALKEVGTARRIDHRSLLAQDIRRVPTVHEGAKWSALGHEETLNYKTNVLIKEMNMESVKEQNHKERESRTTGAETLQSGAAEKRANFFLSAKGPVLKDVARVIHAADYSEGLITLLGAPAPTIEWEQSPLGGCWHIQLADGEVYDYGSQIKCASGSRDEIATAVAIAQRNGWRGLHLTGDDDFKRRAFKEAVAQGFDAATVTGYKASALDLEIGIALRIERHENQKKELQNEPMVIAEEGTGAQERKRKLKP